MFFFPCYKELTQLWKKPVSYQINSYLSVLFYKETRVQWLSRGLRVNRSRFEPWSGCCGVFFFFYFVICYRFHQTSVLLWLIFMATASYAGEAVMLSCWVSEYNNRIQTTSSPTAKSVEFYPIFLALCFCLFKHIFGRSTHGNDFFESLRISLGISTWLHFFPVLLIFSTEYLQKTINVLQSFQDKALPCRNALKGVTGGSWKLRGKIFSLRREYVTVWISELGPVDPKVYFFSVLAVTLQKIINVSK